MNEKLAAPPKDSGTDPAIALDVIRLTGELPQVRYFGSYELFNGNYSRQDGVIFRAWQVPS